MGFRGLFFVASMLAGATAAQADPLAQVRGLAGCYLVDYSYSEFKALAEDYNVDLRVYDVKKFVVKELLQVTAREENAVRLQHFMEASTLEGKVIFKMRHHGETWRRAAESYFRYDGRFDGNDHWSETTLPEPGWVRQIWSLDDGLRYQCPGAWMERRAYPTFACEAFSPIPGREKRDMGRKDYNTLQRRSTVQLFPSAFLERQSNTKILFQGGERLPLAEEVGKIWSSRLPDRDCRGVKAWAAARQPFWDLLAAEWARIYGERRVIADRPLVGGKSRGPKLAKLLAIHHKNLPGDSALRSKVRAEIRQVLLAHLD